MTHPFWHHGLLQLPTGYWIPYLELSAPPLVACRVVAGNSLCGCNWMSKASSVLMWCCTRDVGWHSSSLAAKMSQNEITRAFISSRCSTVKSRLQLLDSLHHLRRQSRCNVTVLRNLGGTRGCVTSDLPSEAVGCFLHPL